MNVVRNDVSSGPIALFTGDVTAPTACDRYDHLNGYPKLLVLGTTDV